MNNIIWWIASRLVFVLIYGVVPALTVWGWIRWARRPKLWSFCSISSLAGFGFATASALLAMSSIIYAHAIGGFSYYDRHLLAIFRWSFLLSVVAFLLAIGGVWRRNVLRWHALTCAIGMALFWIAAATGE